MKTREDFHKLIDNIKDEETLKSFFNLIQNLNVSQTGSLWNELTESQKNELMLSYEESLDPNNLISHEDVKKQHTKWFGK